MEREREDESVVNQQQQEHDLRECMLCLCALFSARLILCEVSYGCRRMAFCISNEGVRGERIYAAAHFQSGGKTPMSSDIEYGVSHMT